MKTGARLPTASFTTSLYTLNFKKGKKTFNLPGSVRHDSEVVFLHEEWSDAVVVEEEVRLVAQAHGLLLAGAENLAADIPRALRRKKYVKSYFHFISYLLTCRVNLHFLG